MKDAILAALAAVRNGYSLCGVVDRRGRVYPLGFDTRVISMLFEIVARQAVASYAQDAGLTVVEPDQQNYYPDFTLMRNAGDRAKIAIDVKSTYRKHERDQFNFTLGSYTSYIHPQTESKNIVFPYRDYREHWVIGFVYQRGEGQRSSAAAIYSTATLATVPIPFDGVEVFMQEKWRIAGDRSGSGNTANIGSIKGTLQDFVAGRGIFASEDEFLAYWRGYKRTAGQRAKAYSNINQFRALLPDRGDA
ncbi:MAG: restriction endonuclease [Betaproteobacteria bacterium]|nr:restriction endonuclease [Betaproteobacteria bacterium]